MENFEDLNEKLARLKAEHRDLDVQIMEAVNSGNYDHLRIKRLKIKKLAIKDEITQLEDDMLPDIIA